MVSFNKQIDGNISFNYDHDKYYAVVVNGTSVPLWEEKLIYVPKRKCGCIDPECRSQERLFPESDVILCPVQPEWSGGDTQEYGANHECWIGVQLFDQDRVDAAVPNGHIPVIAILNNDYYHVHQFLWGWETTSFSQQTS